MFLRFRMVNNFCVDLEKEKKKLILVLILILRRRPRLFVYVAQMSLPSNLHILDFNPSLRSLGYRSYHHFMRQNSSNLIIFVTMLKYESQVQHIFCLDNPLLANICFTIFYF